MNDKNVEKASSADTTEDAFMLPMVDVMEDAAGISVYADLAGVPKDKLHVKVESDTLSIEGEVALPWMQNLQASHVEVQYPRYRRAFTLGQELDRDKVSAEFKHGVLRLHIPKVEHVKPRKIEVQVV